MGHGRNSPGESEPTRSRAVRAILLMRQPAVFASRLWSHRPGAARRRLATEHDHLAAEAERLAADVQRLTDERQHLVESLQSEQSTWAAMRSAVEEALRVAQDPTCRTPALELLALLAPMNAVGVGKTRFGRERDGGYVMLDDLSGIDCAISCGIADETSWDMAIAERGIPVIQVDDSIDTPIDRHALWTFHRRRVVGEASGPSEFSLPDLLAMCRGGSDSVIGKIDIEGSEWDVLPAAGDAFRRFRQVVIEFHDLRRLVEPAWHTRAMAALRAIHATHQPVHVHGNNFRPLVVIGGVPVPDVCEVTFALRSRYRFAPDAGHCPTPLDAPTTPIAAELSFGCRAPDG
jgi:hypothetical protein